MSWEDKLKDIKFSIKTGDGKLYYPLWKNAEKTKEFNYSKYEFIKKEGSLIDRREAKSDLFPLVFWFQGEDNIEQAQAFEDSANDSRAWTVTHPFYGEIKGQPINLNRNDFNYNVTRITVDFWRSIEVVFPESSVSLNDRTSEKVDIVVDLSAAFFAENAKPGVGNIDTMKQNTNIIASEFSADSNSFNDFNNIKTKTLKSIDSLVNNPLDAITNINTLLLAPSNFTTSIKIKLESYVASYNVLKNSINNLFDKYGFESQSATVISAMALTAVNPTENEYVTRSDIENVYNTINDTYNDYLETLDENQVDIYDVEETWTPNSQIQQELSSLVTFALFSLYQISFEARQERLFELTEDSNIILLAHRFLGPSENDENIIRFREINNIKNEQLFLIKKGTVVKYFV